MKIGDKSLIKLNGQLNSSETKAKGGSKAKVADSQVSSSGKTDKVEISSRSRQAQQIRAIVDTTPTEREEKVQAIKSEVDNGTYRVDSDKVAQKVLERALKDSVV